MSYNIERSGCTDDKPFAVVKESDGEIIGCHATEQEAQKQIEAIYANEEKSSDVEDLYEHSCNSYAFSFAELETYSTNIERNESVKQLTVVFSDLLNNILNGYPDNPIMPYDEETPALPSKEELIKNLIMEFSNRMQQLFSDKEDVAEKVKSFIETKYKQAKSPLQKIKNLIGKEKQKDNFMLWKENDGTYRWLAVYSNNYRDIDNPSNIIAAKSHKRFVEMVEKGEAEYPVLMHWHTPGTEWGKADWLAYDEDSGFALASGYIDAGHEREAEILSTKTNIGVSHGMPMSSIKYENVENGVIIEHITVEISDLPHWAAANPLTSFAVLNKEDNGMTIPDMKKEYLRKVGVSDEIISNLDKSLAEAGDKAKESGLEYKETSEVAESEKVEEVETVVEAEEVVAVEETAVEPLAEKEISISEDVVVKAVTDALKPFVEELQQLKKEVEDMSVKAQEMTKEPDLTPALSMSARILKSLQTSRGESVSAEELLKTAPVETREDKREQVVVVRNNPALGAVLSNIITSKKEE